MNKSVDSIKMFDINKMMEDGFPGPNDSYSLHIIDFKFHHSVSMGMFN